MLLQLAVLVAAFERGRRPVSEAHIRLKSAPCCVRLCPVLVQLYPVSGCFWHLFPELSALLGNDLAASRIV